MTNITHEKHERITGGARAKLRTELAAKYRAGRPIRALAADYGLRYGRTRCLLQEEGVTFRPRGGDQRRAVAA